MGPHFLRPDSQIVMIESGGVFRRRHFRRAKAHLLLSAMRHRAAQLGDRVRYIQAETYRDGLNRAVGDAPVTVHHSTSHGALRFVRGLEQVEVLPPRGFLVQPDAFGRWADSAGYLRLEDFYRHVRRDHDLLMDGEQPAGGTWNLDTDNREAPPKGAAAPGRRMARVHVESLLVPRPPLPRVQRLGAPCATAGLVRPPGGGRRAGALPVNHSGAGP
ncbi:deoxyribodipyrimidine photolyase--like protein [Mycobacterium tuberculosis]|nr:deoxyribodipyrimidine photolyase--like protein [Mycobacterium tuberculosis]